MNPNERNTHERLLQFYNNELQFIRLFARDFKDRYPRVAGRLTLDANARSTDPHVERMIEAFALLTANVQVKLDEEFPELSDALLQVLYPHFLAPLPSMAVVQLTLNPGAAEAPTGLKLPKHTMMQTNPVGGVACRYRTAYATTVWPIEVTGAKLREPPWEGYEPPAVCKGSAQSFLRIGVRNTSGIPLHELALDTLRLYISGDSAQLPVDVYEMLFTEAEWVQFRAGRKVVFECPAKECFSQVGFADDEALLPYPKQSFAGYRLLTEFFAYPARFSFVDVGCWQRARAAGLSGDTVEIVVYFNRPPRDGMVQGVQKTTFAAGVVPVVNLFRKTVESFKLTQQRVEHLVEPDVHFPNGYEIYSIDDVVSTDPNADDSKRYRPFYSFEHGGGGGVAPYWYASRRPRVRRLIDDSGQDADASVGTEVFLRFADQTLDPTQPADETVNVRATCLNRELPRTLREAKEELQFELLAALPVRIATLRPPTVTLRPPVRKQAFWRLISHLNLNYLSLGDSQEGLEALREYLRLYDFATPDTDQQLADTARQIVAGITELKATRSVQFIRSGTAGSYVRGIAVDIEVDDEKLTGVGAYLFASVLERFLSLYVSINSFTQLTARSKRVGADPWRWPARAGDQPLL